MDKIYQSAVECWGIDAQYDQAIEECAELIAALKHYKRGKIPCEAVIDELADATLMLGQLRWMFGNDLVDAAIKKKLEKLNSLMTMEQSEKG